jgi:hypothetical protein
VVPEGEGTAFFHTIGTICPTMYHHILKLLKADIIISALYRTYLG